MHTRRHHVGASVVAADEAGPSAVRAASASGLASVGPASAAPASSASAVASRAARMRAAPAAPATPCCARGNGEAAAATGRLRERRRREQKSRPNKFSSTKKQPHAKSVSLPMMIQLELPSATCPPTTSPLAGTDRQAEAKGARVGEGERDTRVRLTVINASLYSRAA